MDTELIKDTAQAGIALIDIILLLLAILSPLILLSIAMQSAKQTKLLKKQTDSLALIAYQLGKQQ